MASGDSLLGKSAGAALYPGASAGQPDVLVGGSTPAEHIPVADLANDEFVDFHCKMPGNYAGGDITLRLDVSASSATSGNFVLGGALRLLGGEQFSGSHSYTFVEATTAAPGSLTTPVTVSLTLTGAALDSVAAHSEFILRLRRNSTGNTMSGDLEIRAWSMHEA